MYFTPVQKETLELIRKYHGLRYDQIQTLMDMRHGKKVRGIKAILRQLEQEKLVEWHGNLLSVAGKPLRADISAATDIMLQLVSVPEGVTVGKEPFALTFFKERDNILYRYDICPVTPGKELIVSAQLEQISPKYRIVIFLLQDLSHREWLSAPCQYRYALQEGGTYYFYEEEENGVQ